MNVKFPNNTSKWQFKFNSAFKELKYSYNARSHERLRMTSVNAPLSLALFLNSPLPGASGEY
jgi:hypothetical protein